MVFQSGWVILHLYLQYFINSFPSSLSAFGVIIVSYFTHSDSCIVESHSGFDSYFPND